LPDSAKTSWPIKNLNENVLGLNMGLKYQEEGSPISKPSQDQDDKLIFKTSSLIVEKKCIP